MMFSIVQLRARTPERVQTSGIFRTNEPPSGNHPSPITTCQLWFRVHCSYILSPNISLVGVSLNINCFAHSTLQIYMFQLFISSCNNYLTYVARQSGDDKLYILYFLNHYWVQVAPKITIVDRQKYKWEIGGAFRLRRRLRLPPWHWIEVTHRKPRQRNLLYMYLVMSCI